MKEKKLSAFDAMYAAASIERFWNEGARERFIAFLNANYNKDEVEPIIDRCDEKGSIFSHLHSLDKNRREIVYSYVQFFLNGTARILDPDDPFYELCDRMWEKLKTTDSDLMTLIRKEVEDVSDCWKIYQTVMTYHIQDMRLGGMSEDSIQGARYRLAYSMEHQS